MPQGIQWCIENNTPRNSRFRFQLADIRNQHYNPAGRYRAEEFVFLHADKSFDLVILVSVFTHMLPAAVAVYLGEIRRVMKPGARCFITWFILNAESEKLIADGRSSLDIRHALDGCMTANPDSPEQTIGYWQDRLLRLYQDARLTLGQPIHFGSWCGREGGVSYQDICVACRE